jgi:hypothetical protein
VRHYEPPVVEHVVAHQSVEELLDVSAELRRFAIELGQRPLQAVADRHLATFELSG